ncbi:MAG: serine hydrolase [Lentisphaeria bacterium]|nr:serine hydrolase [Lentisphaeria bacterium]
MTVLSCATPEKMGVHSEWIINLIKKMSKWEYLHQFSIVRHSQVIATGCFAPYSKADKHHLFSGTKTMTSFAVGLLYDRGIVGLDDKVLKFFPEIQVTDDKWERMTIRHLLTMSSGHAICPMLSAYNTVKSHDFVKIFFEAPLKYEPGEFFVYNTCATYIISEIIKRSSNKDMADWLQEEIFSEMGIKDVSFLRVDNGVPVGGVGGFIRHDDWTKFNLLLLNYGKYDGKQLISEEYMRMASSKQIDNSHNPGDSMNWKIGYGFQIWMNELDGFRADGAYGQYALCFPRLDLLFMINSGTAEMGKLGELIASEFVSKLSPDDTELPENPQAYNELQQLCAALKIPVLSEEVNDASLIGKQSFKCDFKGIKRIDFNGRNSVKITLNDERVIAWQIGSCEYVINEFYDLENNKRKYAIAGHYLESGDFEIVAFDLNSVYRITYLCKIDGDKLRIKRDIKLTLLNGNWDRELEGELIS